MAVLPFASNHTRLSTPSASTPTFAVTSKLAPQLSSIENSSQRLRLSDAIDQPSSAGAATGSKTVEIPLYAAWEKHDGDRIHDLTSFCEAWGDLYEKLTTGTLAESDVLDVLKSGILQKKTGSNLVHLFVEAMIRSIQPKGDLAAQRLREIVEIVCHLPQKDWAKSLGEHLDFAQGTDNRSVSGFIQAQLRSSRQQRDVKIANGELLTHAQWHCLCEIVEESPVWLRDRLEQRLDEEGPGRPSVDLEDIAHIRPSPYAAQTLMEKCLQVLSENTAKNDVPSEYESRVQQFLGCIADKSDPPLLTQRNVEEVASLDFYKPSKVRVNGVTPSGTNRRQEGFQLLAVLEEIERKSNFYEGVATGGPRIPSGLLARTVFGLNALNVFDVRKLDASPEKPIPKPLLLLADKATQPMTSSDFLLNLQSTFRRSSGGTEHVLEMARQVDALLTEITHAVTGWKPVEAALDLQEPHVLLSDIEKYIKGVNVRTARPVTPESSYGAQGNPYATTTQANDAAEVGNLETLGASLGTWLHSAAGHLATMGAAALTQSVGLAQQNPRAAATLAFAATHAVVNAFYHRWFAHSTDNNPPRFADETDPELRKAIIENVESVLNSMPEVIQSIRERMAKSTYADLLQDPGLVPDVKSLLQQPLDLSPDMTAAELVDESVLNTRRHYANLQISRMEVDDNGSSHVVVEDISTNVQPAKSDEVADDSAHWAIDTLSEADITRHADQTLQAEVVERLASNRHTPLPISTDSWIHKPLALFQEALNDPKVLAWFESKGLELDTLLIESNQISGFVTRNGRSTMEMFTLSDSSGWWQVSAQVRAAREVLDPGNHGLPYVNEDPKLIPLDVILEFYGQSPPDTREEEISLSSSLKSNGWPAFDSIKKGELLDRAKELIKEEKARAQLSHELEQSVGIMEDDQPVSLASRFSRVANNSPLEKKSSEILHHLNDFLLLPEMIEVCKSRNFDCSVSAVRVSEGRIQVLNTDTLWHDITTLLTPTLKVPFNKLLEQVKETGNALYSTLSFDLQQIVNFRGFGSPKTAGEVRNVIRWLHTSLPPPKPLGDFGTGLLSPFRSPAKLTSEDRVKIINLSNTQLNGAASIIDVLGKDLLLDRTVEYRRAHAEDLLEEMLMSQQSLSWGKQLLKELGWYGASEGQTASIEQQQHLLIAAIKLAVDPGTPGKPGTIAGYDIYQPKNRGRDLDAVRADIERYLVAQKGVSEQAAPLVAHLFLAEAAPEFLTTDAAEGIQVGTVGWMTLRLGVAIAEIQQPGCSRAMTADQLIALALLTPTTPEQQALFKGLAMDIVVAWGVMNGIIRQLESASYSYDDYLRAANRFAAQRKELSESVEGFKRDLQTREELAIRELRRVYGRHTSVPIEDIKVRKDGPEKSLVDAYMEGELSDAGWYMSNVSMKRGDFDGRRIYLEDINVLLTTSVDQYFTAYNSSFIVATKSLIASLPLEDRQHLELGEVKVFTLRKETGKLLEDETPESQAAFRGRQGVLLRSQYKTTFSYYEVFPGRMSIIKRTDLPEELTLNGAIENAQVRVSKGGYVTMPIRQGTELKFDFSAYSEGSVPDVNATSKVIIEPLGNTLPGKTISKPLATYVPNTYFSRRTADIAKLIVVDNLLQGERDFLFKKAKGQTTAEEDQLFWGKVKDFLVQLIPFVGCVDDLKSGERIRLINGAFGCFTDLISGLNALAGGVGKISVVMKSVSSVIVKAFETLKITGVTLLSAVNPLDGIPDLIAGGGRAVGAFGKMLSGGSFALTEAGVSRLGTCVDRLRGYFGGFASGAASRLPLRAKVVSVMGRLDNTPITATLDDGKWFALDRNGNPIGRPLDNFIALPEEGEQLTTVESTA